MSVLVLNASYEPLGVIGDQRAVVLVVTDEVDVVSNTSRSYRSPSITVVVPSVVALRQYVKVPYRSLARLTRKNVLARDGYECAYCDARANTVDHVVPRAKGGQHSWLNVVAACEPCNNRKSDTALTDLGWVLRHTPFEPSPMEAARWGQRWTDPDWEMWLDPASA